MYCNKRYLRISKGGSNRYPLTKYTGTATMDDLKDFSHDSTSSQTTTDKKPTTFLSLSHTN